MTEQDPRIEKLNAIRAAASMGGGADKIEKQHAKGSLTARERIALLLDKGTFHELEAYTTQQIRPIH